MADFIMGLLMYLLGSAAIISVASVFGLTVGILQAISVWIVFSLAVAIIKNV